MDQVIDLIKDKMLVVKFGQGQALYNLQKTEMDLVNKTTISDMIDAATACDYFFGQCSFIIPLAESLKKPCMILWSSKGLRAPHEYVRLVTPEKILHEDTSKWMYDDWPHERIARTTKEFFK
jgi:ADP-heptose:LPS heptosyltransferase